MAQIRLSDARANGYDQEDQITAFRYSYDECVKWEAKGYVPEIP